MRHAVVTGAADGIGRALLDTFAHKGYALTGVDVDAARAGEAEQALAARGAQVAFALGDLGQMNAVDHIAHQLIAGPTINVLVHNAGINCVGPFAMSDIGAQQQVLNINLRAPLLLTAALLRAGKITPGGSLIFISSLSHFAGYPGAAVYAAAKDGLASYARSIGVAVAPQGIHVLVVYPGPTRTAHARKYSPDNRRESKRMAPEVLAAAIVRAMERRQRVLVAGAANKAFALAGRWAPGFTEWAMRKSLYEKIK
jgi:short-subunit dehydrogenase